MGWSKRQFVTAAFEELGMADYVFDLGPEELQGAVRRLDTLISEWSGLGIQLGYPLVSNPDNSDLDTDTQVPISSNSAVFLNLAIRIAPSYGKTPQPETKLAAKKGYDILFARAAQPSVMQLTANTPLGAGNKMWRGVPQPFVIPPTDSDIGEPQPDVVLPQGI